jgi:protein SCO1/2
MAATDGHHQLTRRGWLAATASAVVWTLPLPAEPHAPQGRVDPPQAAPSIELVGADGKSVDLRRVLAGNVTAVHLMFTGCSATCPIQGALFAAAQTQLSDAPANLRLLSLSIDPLADGPQALQSWLARFGADPNRWSAAAPRVAQLDRLLDFLVGRSQGQDRHVRNVFLFDQRADLVFRTADMPPGLQVAAMLRSLRNVKR